MAKNIILLSDGTGSSSAKIFKTNVWRLFQTLDLSDPNSQIAYYDDGVGSSPFILFAILGGIFGFGLKRNVIDIYSFCCRNYQPGDRIYCFGFSRGAFTIRIVAKLIAYLGLVKYEKNEAALASNAADVFRLYRRRFDAGKHWVPTLFDLFGYLTTAWRWLCTKTDPALIKVDSIQFVGLWDTVDAYGGPIDEITRTIDHWIWPLSMPDRFMSAKVLRACHALAVDEERDAFQPVIWDQRYVRVVEEIPGREKTDWLLDINYHPPSETGEVPEVPPHLRTELPPIDRERISQVWFSGVHGDIGGGYSRDGLSYVTLDWMMDRAEAYGLLLLSEQRRSQVAPRVNLYDKINDSRVGLAAYYRYKPRNIADIYSAPAYKPAFDTLRHALYDMEGLLHNVRYPHREILDDLHPSMPRKIRPPPPPTVHDSVFKRIAHGADSYAPVVLPAQYNFTDKAGTITQDAHPADNVDRRFEVQQGAWSWVWLRRVIYFLAVFATWSVVAMPFFVIYFPDVGYDSIGTVIVPIIDFVASFLPAFLQPWSDAFRSSPGPASASVFAFAFLLHLGNTLRRRIHDVMRIAWHSTSSGQTPARWQGVVYRLRHRRGYRMAFYVVKNLVVPTGIFLSLMFWLSSWLAFGTANTLGLICRGVGAVEVGDLNQIGGAPKALMETSKICNATGMKVAQGVTYRIELTVVRKWKDSGTETDPNGFNLSRTSWLQLFGVPYRRLMWSNWFATILRIGGPGLEEHPLHFEQTNGAWVATFRPRSNGEVFLYVNDAVIGLPWIYDLFYWLNNSGTAEVRLEKVRLGELEEAGLEKLPSR